MKPKQMVVWVIMLGLIFGPFNFTNPVQGFLNSLNADSGPRYEPLYSPTIQGYDICLAQEDIDDILDCEDELLFSECGIADPYTADYETVIRPCLYPDAEYCDYDFDLQQEVCYRRISTITNEQLAQDITENQRASNQITSFNGAISPTPSLHDPIYVDSDEQLEVAVLPNTSSQYEIAVRHYTESAQGDVDVYFSGSGDSSRSIELNQDGVYLIAIYDTQQPRNCQILSGWRPEGSSHYSCQENGEDYNRLELEQAVFVGQPRFQSVFSVNRTYANGENSNILAVSYLTVIVGDEVEVTPIPEEPITCCSNVVFLHGVQGSYLEHADGDRLWLPTTSASNDLKQLQMNSAGNSVNSVRVGEAIQSAFLGRFKGYEGLFNTFNDMKASGQINDWQSFNYDWRYGPFDVATKSISLVDGLNYTMIDRIIDFADQAPNDKVSLVTHSNGGLVAKALMIELEELGLDDIVDRIIFTVPPHLGTPKGIASVLHGSEQGLAKGMLTTEAQARELSLNMPSAYVLSPSKKLFDSDSEQFLIAFDQSSDLVRDLYGRYGSTIDTWTEYLQFLSGADGRTKPDYNDLATPSIVNGMLYGSALSDHQILDNWQPLNSDLEISTIAGVGFNTVRGWKYVEDSKWTLTGKKSFVYPELIRTRAGDGTVVVSATDGVGDMYYFDQEKFRSESDEIQATHSELFRAQDVNDCIGGLLVGNNGQCASSFIHDQIIYVDTNYYEIVVHSPIRLLATDGETGYQTGQLSDGSIVIQIPGSNYETFAGSSYLDLATTSGVTIEYFYDNSNELDYQSAVFRVTEYQSGNNPNQILRTRPLVVDKDSQGVITIHSDREGKTATVESAAGLLIDIDMYDRDNNSDPTSGNNGGGRLITAGNNSIPNDGQVRGEAVNLLSIRIQLLKKILNLDVPTSIKKLLLELLFQHD